MILAVIIGTYLVSSVIVYFLANSNVIPSRRYKEYKIGFGAELIHIRSEIDPDKKVAYWKAKNGNSDKNVIFLHGFTRTSDKLQDRAKIYWELGYNLFFVDNLGHGYSSNQLYPSGYRYSREVKNLILSENIERPIIHGLSMGAIAASVIAQQEPEIPKAIVCEALPKDFNNLYKELLNYLNIPYWLFPWIEWVSRQLNWKQFDELGLNESDYRPTQVDCPWFLIHSASDTLFDPETHFQSIVNQVKNEEQFMSWLVDDARHTNMDQDAQYPNMLQEFLRKFG